MFSTLFHKINNHIFTRLVGIGEKDHWWPVQQTWGDQLLEAVSLHNSSGVKITIHGSAVLPKEENTHDLHQDGKKRGLCRNGRINLRWNSYGKNQF